MQPYIFPYIGYFSLISSVDKFIFLDDVTFIKKGWINRNRYRGDKYFTIPINDISQNRLINQHYINWEDKWKQKLLKTFYHTYNKESYFSETYDTIIDLFDRKGNEPVDSFASYSLKYLCNLLEINTSFDWSSLYPTSLKNEQKIIEICQKLGAKSYHNLPGGATLYNKENFLPIELKFININSDNYLSIIDLLMRYGFKDTRLLIEDYCLNYG